MSKPVSIGCGVVIGVDAVPVILEATLRSESSTLRILGSADPIVREAYYRVLNAFEAQEIEAPRGMPMINFIPAEIRKSGSSYDLPMAIALAAAGGVVPERELNDLVAFGEVALNGQILPVRGIVPIALAARSRGWRRLLTSPEDAELAASVPGIDVIPVPDLRTALHYLGGHLDLEPEEPPPRDRSQVRTSDLADLRGHETPKRALQIAAAGRHNLLMVGPPGSGKSALVRRLDGIMPPLTRREEIEILKIHSVHGTNCSHDKAGVHRPMRCPHHTSSAASLLGGGPHARPGEVTLAQHGALFLDELPEFRREVLEGLRQPLEDGVITIGRAKQTVTMPADFLLVAAMNPCPCGYAGTDERLCSCTNAMTRRYTGRVSGPLLDRFDLQVFVPTLAPERFREPRDVERGSENIYRQVVHAVERQRARNPSACPNARLDGRSLEQACVASDETLDTLDAAMSTYQLSGRARTRILRIARTIADIAASDRVRTCDVLEAIHLRCLDLS